MHLFISSVNTKNVASLEKFCRELYYSVKKKLTLMMHILIKYNIYYFQNVTFFSFYGNSNFKRYTT